MQRARMQRGNMCMPRGAMWALQSRARQNGTTARFPYASFHAQHPGARCTGAAWGEAGVGQAVSQSCASPPPLQAEPPHYVHVNTLEGCEKTHQTHIISSSQGKQQRHFTQGAARTAVSAGHCTCTRAHCSRPCVPTTDAGRRGCAHQAHKTQTTTAARCGAVR